MVEVKRGGRWVAITEKLFPWNETYIAAPFDERSYAVFGFLADVRNASFVPPLSAPRGFPSDLSPGAEEQFSNESGDLHSNSWLSLAELLDFDYSRTFEDRRGAGGNDVGPGNGRITTFEKFLGPRFFRDLDIMKRLAEDPQSVRVIFCFDS